MVLFNSDGSRAEMSGNGIRCFAQAVGAGLPGGYVIETDAGTPIEGVFPDREVHWPRLFYHRHLMLADNHWRVYRTEADSPPANQRNPSTDAIWAAEKRRSEIYTRSYCEHLLHKHANQGARRVTLFGLVRGMPSPDDVKAGRFPGAVETRELVTYPPREK
jgi:hypothetical protein